MEKALESESGNKKVAVKSALPAEKIEIRAFLIAVLAKRKGVEAMSNSKKNLVGELKACERAYYIGEDGKRHLVEPASIPPGHMLVRIVDPSHDDCEEILKVVPVDSLHPL